ncbi:MAG TPA: hypothetical protein VD994_19720 [Prosthecobacter sp.]|nr:hypothetical protein [Prosthecobacter sp.]
MKIADLLTKAQGATPQVESRANWAPLAPVVEALKGNGFTVWKAVAWLVQEKAVPAKQQRNAYHSILRCIKRREAAAEKAKDRKVGA